ncbi:radical SAM/SPASM domain-containing protein [Roseobacter sp. HKCC-CH-9208]|uniref:radical SAM/SPASM domain-containing protein n=1 Tax=Roseobacter sp. HKCC-CH-9208 TaxID=3120339 RepID=UPI0030ED62A9
MSASTFGKILHDIEELGRLKVLRLIGTGEPLLNKNFLTMAQLAKQSEFIDKVELTTNALLFGRKEYKEKLTENLDRIIISIEGLDGASYHEVAGVKVDFDKLVNDIKELYEMRSNKDCIIYIKIHNNSIKSDRDLQKFYDLFADKCDEIFVENLVNLWPETVSNLGLDNGHRFGFEDKRQLVCSQIFKSMMINANGDVVPCCVDFKRVNRLGNVNSMSLKEIWDGQQLLELRKKHLSGQGGSISPCSGCSYYQSDLDNIDDHRFEILNRIS